MGSKDQNTTMSSTESKFALPSTSEMHLNAPGPSIVDEHIKLGSSPRGANSGDDCGPEPPTQDTTYRYDARSNKLEGGIKPPKTLYSDTVSPTAMDTLERAGSSTSTPDHSGPWPDNRLWRSRLPDHLTQAINEPISKLQTIPNPPVPGSKGNFEYQSDQPDGHWDIDRASDTLLSGPNSIPDMPSSWSLDSYNDAYIVAQDVKERIEVIHKANKADGEWSSKPEGAMVGGAATLLNSAREIAVDLECATHEMQDATNRLLDQMGEYQRRGYLKQGG